MDKEGEGKEEEEGWTYFTTRMDSKGRLVVPPDDRENMGVYKKTVQVAVKVKLLQIYEAENG